MNIFIRKGRVVKGNYIYVRSQKLFITSQVVCALRPLSIGIIWHYFARFRTWRKIVMMRAAFFVISLFIVFSAFPHLFHTKILYLESLRVTKSYFGIEVLTFRACQGNLSNFFNRIKFSHFCLF